jgi:hypothetical protein
VFQKNTIGTEYYNLPVSGGCSLQAPLRIQAPLFQFSAKIPHLFRNIKNILKVHLPEVKRTPKIRCHDHDTTFSFPAAAICTGRRRACPREPSLAAEEEKGDTEPRYRLLSRDPVFAVAVAYGAVPGTGALFFPEPLMRDITAGRAQVPWRRYVGSARMQPPEFIA